MSDNKNKFINLDNIKVVWENINDRFVRFDDLSEKFYDLSEETFSGMNDSYIKISSIYNSNSYFNMSDDLISFLESNHKKILKDLDGSYFNVIGVYKEPNSKLYSILLNKVGDINGKLGELSFIEIYYEPNAMFEYNIKWLPLISSNDLSSYDIK